jgi:hypothetical protein
VIIHAVDTHIGDAGHTGTGEVTGTLDLADLLDVETAISQGAAELKALGCEESLDVRRSMAAGMLARRANMLDLNGDDQAAAGSGLVKPSYTTIRCRPGCTIRPTDTSDRNAPADPYSRSLHLALHDGGLLGL